MSADDTIRHTAPALPNLFTWTEEGPRLMSAVCISCHTYFFPAYHEQHRPGCSRSGIKNVLLNRVGTLVSYTIQHYMPPPPFRTQEDITPYVVGLIEFPEGIQISGIVVDCSPDAFKIGMSMETTTFTLYREDGGTDIVTWAFKPATGIR